MKIGLLKEEKIPEDKRVVLTPKQCKRLKDMYTDVELVVQSSNIRCFSDDEYIHEGVNVVHDVSDCDILLGVKEVPEDSLIPNKTYFYFSHTIKMQPYNRELLVKMIALGVTMVDYEVLKNQKGERLLGFGRYAGIVGAYNGFLTYGLKTGKYKLKEAHKCKDREKGVGYVRARDILPLKYLTFMGRDFLIPNNETSYLTKYYGSTWHIIDREGKGDWHDEEDELHVMEESGDVNHPINLRALRLNSPRVYVDVVGDLVHFGHVNLFKQARRWGASLIVGVHNDSTVSSYKRRPIMNMEERINAIKDFSMVDMVIPNAPLKVSKAYLKYHQISIVVHGDDTPMDTLQLMYGDAMELGIFKTVPYTKGISTSDIIQRIVERSKLNDDYNRLSKKTT